MATKVTARPNHYEVLGLTPDATGEQVAQAFARELSLLRPRPFGSLADVTIAYETLRDPAKRKAYDKSLGLGREPLRPAPKAPADWKPFLARASMNPAEGFAFDRRAAPATAAFDDSLLERLAPSPGSSASAVMREPIRPEARDPEPVPIPDTEALRVPADVQEPPPERQAEPQRPLQFFEDDHRRDRVKAMRDRALPAAAAGALGLAVVIGAWTGWNAGSGGDSQAPQQSVTLKVPRAEQAATTSPAPTVPTEAAKRLQAEPQPRTVAAAPRPVRSRQPLQIAMPEEEAVQPVAQGQPEEAAAEPQAAIEPAAKLPLPNAVIARTIGHIGYSCGSIASATPVGSDGVFTVTCTSGHSYRASPVRGRYHFRRLS